MRSSQHFLNNYIRFILIERRVVVLFVTVVNVRRGVSGVEHCFVTVSNMCNPCTAVNFLLIAWPSPT